MTRRLATLVLTCLTLGACDRQASQYREAFEATIAEDYRSARVILTELARGGYPPAQARLGQMYDFGLGVEPDPRAALHWYRMAADKGEVSAQYYLAQAQLKGRSGHRDLEQAFYWFHRLAEHGYPPAQHQVALMYRDGIGVDKDSDAALQWLRSAGENGYALARRALLDPAAWCRC